MAFKIVLHAFNMIFGNIIDALKVSIGPSIVFCLIGAVVFFLIGPSFEELIWILQGQTENIVGLPSDEVASTGAVAQFRLFIFVSLILLMVFFAWIAVAWHRFVLLEEYPSTLPQFRDRPIIKYLGKSFGITLIIIALVFVALLIGVIISMVGGLSVLSIVKFGVTVLISYVWFRFAISLPGIAVGRSISLGEAWSISKPLDTQIIGIALILMLIGYVSDIVLSPIYGVMPIVAVVFDLGINWVVMMLGISILTTLYGHLVEGRELI